MEKDELLEKVLKGENLSESELCDLAYEYPTFDVENGDDRRWSKSVINTYKIEDRYFQLIWDKGLTEYQEDGFYEQPYEVCFEETKKMIEVVTRNYKKI